MRNDIVNIPKRMPVAVAVGVDVGVNKGNYEVSEVFIDQALLGHRWQSIVVFTGHPRFDRQWCEDILRCRLEPGGTWVELP